MRRAYEAHAEEGTQSPPSKFLSLPGDSGDRIIALPAYLGGDFRVAGIKWISSFPGNISKGLQRASGILILNSILTGRATAIMEASAISAARTAASAALAAQFLSVGEEEICLGVIGCGVINFQIVKFISTVFPRLRKVMLLDIDSDRAQQFSKRCSSDKLQVTLSEDIETVLREASLISFATTALTPHVFAISDCRPGATILHISLRDLSAEVIRSCDNVVDDVDHVCRAGTSLHLAEQAAGDRSFIRCSLGDILRGISEKRRTEAGITVFSPFGLGILDLAVGSFVYHLALANKRGKIIPSFMPNTVL